MAGLHAKPSNGSCPTDWASAMRRCLANRGVDFRPSWIRRFPRSRRLFQRSECIRDPRLAWLRNRASTSFLSNCSGGNACSSFVLTRIRREAGNSTVSRNAASPPRHPQAKRPTAGALAPCEPRLATTFATVGGLIPLNLSGGSLWESLTAVHIFGLLFATGLTLILLPVVYYLFAARWKWIS